MVGTLGKKVSDVVINIDGSATGAVAAIATTEGALGGLGGVATATAATMASALAVATAGLSILFGAAVAVVAAVGLITDKSEEHNKILQKTASILGTNGAAYSDNADAINSNVESLSALTGITENELLTSMNKLLTAQISVSDAFRMNKVAADLAYTADIDMAGASDIVKQALMGKVDGLGDYGFVLDATATKEQIISDILEQQPNILSDAADAQGSLTVQNQKLSESLGNFAERLGNMVTPMVIDSVTAINEWGDAGGWDKVMGAIKGVMVVFIGLYEVVNFYNQAVQASSRVMITFAKDYAIIKQLTSGLIDAAEATRLFNENTENLATGLVKDYNDFMQPIQYLKDMINETGSAINDNTNINRNGVADFVDGEAEKQAALEETAATMNRISIEQMRASYYQEKGGYVSPNGEVISGTGEQMTGQAYGARPVVEVAVDTKTMEELLMEMNRKLSTIASKGSGFSAGV